MWQVYLADSVLRTLDVEQGARGGSSGVPVGRLLPLDGPVDDLSLTSGHEHQRCVAALERPGPVEPEPSGPSVGKLYFYYVY